MFFFIGGVQPKTIELDKESMNCPSCGLYGARLKRTDHYLSIFFLPIVRVKKGEPFMTCERCGHVSLQPYDGSSHSYGEAAINQCPSCMRQIQRDFRFCPFCGKKL